MADRRQLFTEMRAQNFDAIRLSTYRAACKLRFVQKRCSLHLVDTWSLLEVFREQGLAGRADGTVTTGAMAPSGSGGGGVGDGGVGGGGSVGVDMSVAQLERLVLSLYVQLNKKLSSQQQLSAEACSGLLLSFLLAAIDSEGLEKVTTFSVKVTLATMCGGKIVDKLRYLFSELSDGSGVLMWSRFDRFLQDVLALPTAVFEGPSFGYNAQTARACFPNPQRVTQSIFLDALMSEPPPQCLAWLPLIHRLCSAENVFHPVECSFCHSESMLGFRYRCQQCRSYQLCQDCFWRGQASSTHSNQHQMKEYTSWKSPAKKLGAAISKTLGCVSGRENSHALYPESPDNGAETTHVGLPWSHSSAMDGVVPSSNRSSVLMAESPGRSDDEHHLIARYAARLAAEDNRALAAGEISPLSMDVNKHQRQLIAELESRNREILQEIQRLRVEHERASRAPAAPPDRDHHSPALLTELRLLRQRKEELERRMSALQENRRELVQQLDSLMKLLKTQGSGSPRSSPGHTASRPIPTPIRTPSCGSSPAHTPQEPPPSPGGDPHTPPFSQGFRRNLCNDLLVAADSIASTMTSLVRELDSDISGDEDDGGFFPAARDRDPIRRQSGGGRREWEPPPHGLPSPPSPDLIILAPSSARRHLGGSGAPHCVQDEGLAAPSPRGAGEGCAGGEPLKHRVPPANSPLPLAHALESSSGQDEDLASGSSAGQHNNSGGGGGGGGGSGDEGGRVRRSLVQ